MIPVTDMDALTDMVVRFCKERDWDQVHNLKDLAIGISTEAGELLDIFRFRNESECMGMMSTDKGRTDISDELADVLFFVLRFAHVAGIDLEDALYSKIAKNAEKYPVEKAKGSNLKYSEL